MCAPSAVSKGPGLRGASFRSSAPTGGVAPIVPLSLALFALAFGFVVLLPDVGHFAGVGFLLCTVVCIQVPGGPFLDVIAGLRDTEDGSVPGPWGAFAPVFSWF